MSVMRIQLRRGRTARWTEVNPVLAEGEPGVDLTVNRMKLGDGRTPWQDLGWVAPEAAEVRELALEAATPTLGRARLTAALAAAAGARGPTHVVYLGSSTTFGSNTLLVKNRFTNLLTRHLQAAHPSGLAGYEPPTRVLTGAVVTRSELPGVHGWNAGFGGWQASDYVPDWLRDNLARIRPRVLVHMVGPNDYAYGVAPATYAARVEAAIARIDTAVGDRAVHVLVHSFARRDISSPAHPWSAYGEALRSVWAADPGSRVLVDLAASYADARAHGDQTGIFGDDDLAHQTDAGHAFMAAALRDALRLPGAAAPAAYTFHDSFDRADGALGTAPSGQPWDVVSGTFSIDACHATLTEAGTALVHSGLPSGDLDLSGVLTVAGASLPGLVFRASSGAERLGVFLNSGNDTVALYRTQGGGTTVDAQAATTVTTGTDYALRVVAVGNLVMVFLNGRKVLEHEYETTVNDVFKGNRLVGIRANSASPAITWDHLGVCAL